MSDMDPRERGTPVMLGSKPAGGGAGGSWGGWLDTAAGMVTGGFEDMAKDGSAIGTRAATTAKKIITDGALGDYPGYGTLWTYDTKTGAQIQTKGWMALGGAAVVLYFVLKG